VLRLVGFCMALLAATTAIATDHGRSPNPQETAQASAAARQAIDEAQRQQQSVASTGTRYPLVLPDAASSQPAASLHEIGAEARPWRDSEPVPMVVLVSFSMPEPTLRELARQAARLGVPLVLRGLVDDSLEATAKRMQAYQDITDFGFAIDPTLFSRFKVDAVPTYVLLLDPLQSCSDSACPVPRHVRVAGEAGLDHVLETMRRSSREPGAREAAVALLGRLEKQP